MARIWPGRFAHMTFGRASSRSVATFSLILFFTLCSGTAQARSDSSVWDHLLRELVGSAARPLAKEVSIASMSEVEAKNALVYIAGELTKVFGGREIGVLQVGKAVAEGRDTLVLQYHYINHRFDQLDLGFIENYLDTELPNEVCSMPRGFFNRNGITRRYEYYSSDRVLVGSKSFRPNECES